MTSTAKVDAFAAAGKCAAIVPGRAACGAGADGGGELCLHHAAMFVTLAPRPGRVRGKAVVR